MMEDLNFVNIDGVLVPKDEKVIGSSNRSFLYGDGIFESMHATGSKVQFLEEHYNRLIESADKLYLKLPEQFSRSFLEREIERFFHRNRYFKGARIRLSIYRNEGGLYTPETNSISWVIQGSKLLQEDYTLNKRGLIIDLFEEIHKPINLFSGIKSANSLLFVMAGLYKKRMSLDEVLIVNDKGDIIESSSSNLFVYRNNQLFTPELSDGPLPGIMRGVVIHITKRLGVDLVFCKIAHDLLLEADEVFLTNAVHGIQWVSAYKSKRYFNQISSNIVKVLNQMAKIN